MRSSTSASGSVRVGRRLRGRAIPALLGLAVLAAGCGSDSDSPSDRDPAGLTSAPLPTGEEVAFLLEETRAKLLCAALDDAKWSELLGEPVQRTPNAEGQCKVSSAKHAISLELSDREKSEFDSREPIAGRSARVFDMGGLGSSLQVSLFDNLAVRGYRSSYLTPYLDIIASADKDVDPRGEQVAQALVQKLTQPGPELPEKGQFVPTPPTPGVDPTGLPVPLIARQLCTAALDAAEQTPTTATLFFTGDTPSCTFVQPPNSGIIKHDDGFWDFHIALTKYTADRPTGRPGEIQPTTKNPGGYQTCLDDTCQYWLSIEGEDTGSPVKLREVAERAVARVFGT